MKKITKKEARERKAAYQKALSEGRIVNVSKGDHFKSFATSQEAQEYAAKLVVMGINAIVVGNGSIS